MPPGAPYGLPAASTLTGWTPRQPCQPTATTPTACPGGIGEGPINERVRDDPSICTRREAADSDREGVKGSIPTNGRIGTTARPMVKTRRDNAGQ